MKQLTDGGTPAAGQVARGGFGSQELQVHSETALSAAVAREQATIQAMYIMAERHPRDTEVFRTRLLKEVSRPGFAEEASYARPAGKELNKKTGNWEEKTARGPSIRLIEVALCLYRNVWQDSQTTLDTDDTRIVRTKLTDLENNVTFTADVTVSKVVERKGKADRQGKFKPPEGRDILSERVNSSGDPVYQVRATDDETTFKASNLLSKALRKNGERLLPKDIINEAREVAYGVAAAKDAADPDAAKRKIIDNFADLDISAVDLAAFLRHSLDRIQPAELTLLRQTYVAIRDGLATWDEVMEAKDGGGSQEQQDELKAKLEADAKAKLATMKPAAKPVAETVATDTKTQISGELTTLTEEEMAAATAAADAQAEQSKTEAAKPERAKPVFGVRK